MTSSSFYEEGSKLLTASAFAFVLDSELKRAVRSASFLTLVVVEASRQWEGMTLTADEGTVQEVAQIISREMRQTDALGYTDSGTLGLMLIDTDFDLSTKLIDRLVSRIDSYDFSAPLYVAIGAACYPTHAVDADTLIRQARSHPLVNWRRGSRQPADQN